MSFFISFIKYLKYFSSFILLLFVYVSANAQLQANFTVDKNGGCSPLSVSFTNTTTNASSGAVYKWDFGNGNTSTLANAGATYVLEQTYTVTLTVTDGSKSSSQTKQITVYKRPTVDFSFDVVKGCLPLPVNFTANATAGDGTIANYYWDFGDGNTQQTSSSQIAHAYNLAQNTDVGLTVTNNYGCYTSVEKPATKVLGAIQASFTADKTVLCSITDAAKFTNTSSGPGTLNYAWDFGDGTTSTVFSPNHFYNKKGIYTVGLTVSNTDGCSNTDVQTNYINAADYQTDFDVPPLICTSQSAMFTDKSTSSGQTAESWVIDNNNYGCYGCAGAYFYLYFGDTLKHTVQLVNTYGTCMDTVTKQVSAKLSPFISPFVIDILNNCGPPVTVNFKDTTQGAVQWLWNFNSTISGPFSSVQSPSYIFQYPLQNFVQLTVTNAAGCTASETQGVNTFHIEGSISLGNNDNRWGCDSVSATFSASANDSIVNYKWNFGDGATSTLPQPQHTFTTEGSFTVTLQFTTKNGCSATTTYEGIHVSKKHPADITVTQGTTICGNTTVQFNFQGSPQGYFNWDFGDGGSGNFYSQGGGLITHQYSRDSLYTISVAFYDTYGLCPDTVTKKDFLKVLPPFPKISAVQNTCDGSRGLVTFADTSYKALTWNWDFDDGTVSGIYNTHKPQITHTYAATGAYKVVLTTTNGACSVQDNAFVYVLLKQKPVLTANATNACTNGPVTINFSNIETNPAPDYIIHNEGYKLFAIQYGDGSNFNGSGIDPFGWQSSGKTWYISDFDASKKDLRVISTSNYFGCDDTTNFVPLKINGPKAGFKFIESSPCFAYPVIMQDTSVAGINAPITSWQWIFGDNTFSSETKSGIESHIYAYPGQYQVQLSVTDVNGCSDITYYYANFANPSGPKSSFTYNPVNVTPNTQVSFFNNTNIFNTSSNIQYKWLFGDGSSSTDFSPAHSYATTGTYTVKLIASNPGTHCIDTSTQIINVKIINTQFSFTSSYISSNSCPPVIVHFTNTSSNALSVAWDFGDGSKADNQNNPSHTYYNAGTYKISMYGYGYNGTTDTTVDSIVVKAPFAKLTADAYFGCLSKTITLNATIQNANSFVWDFGDGTINQTKDSFSTHSYLSPGIYSPALIMTDSNGCSLLSYLAQKIVVDSLAIKINETPAKLCGPGLITFSDPVVTSFAEQMQQPLQYHWNFGTGNNADTSNIIAPSFAYNNYGKSYVQVTVQSPYGCIKQAMDSVLVVPKAIASINGPSEICQDATAQFSGSASLMDNDQWQWIFNNGNNSVVQNPSSQIFNNAGNYKILLIVSHSGCYDTAINNLTVHPTPVVNASPKQAFVCLGKTIQLNANDGTNYLWSPANTLSNNIIASPIATPVINITYIVQSTTSFGCSAIDSSVITVAQPFKVKIPADTFVCKGSSIMLYASGATTYNWISGDGLSNTQISNPVATPQLPTAFTVVGYDAYKCFTDTETVHINIEPLPTVNAGPDVQTLTGSDVQLGATGSTDVTQWSWLPVDYLSCTDCESPVSTPRSDITYIVTGKNIYGCAASDTVVIKLVCAEDRVYVPSVFSPNNDGNNDVFYIKGKGIKTIKSLRIFSRWGQMVFERTNINIDDRTAGWDGNFKGSPVATGAYVYIAQLQCDTGEVYELKGTLVITR